MAKRPGRGADGGSVAEARATRAIRGRLPVRSEGAAVVLAAAFILVKSASAASPVQIVAATVNADRSVSVSWNIPASSWGGDLIINPTSTTDPTGGMPFGSTTVDYQIFGSGRTHYTTLPLRMSIQSPVTVYVQVQLIDPYDNTLSCQQGGDLVDCDSQVVALTVTPMCTQVLVKAGYYTKTLVRRGHWLRQHGHFVRRHGHRVWVKAAYRHIYHRPVYETRCH